MTRSCSEQFVKQESPVSRIYASDRGLAFFPTRAACIASGAISWQLKACSRDIYVGTNCPLRRRNRLTVEGVIGRRGEPAARKTAGVPSRGPQFFRHRVSRYREFFDRSFEKAVTRFSLSNPLSLSLSFDRSNSFYFRLIRLSTAARIPLTLQNLIRAINTIIKNKVVKI